MKPKVFLSYSSKDMDRVKIIKTVLENEGIECWLDKDKMQAGDTIVQGIQKGLSEADFVIFFVSSHSLESAWVDLEITSSLVAQMQKKVPRVIPVKLENIEMPDIYKNIVSADLTDAKSIEGATLLARTIYSHFEAINISIGTDENIVENLPLDLNALGKYIPAKGFHWIILSGASSAGKDVLGYLLDQHLSIDYDLDIAIKYTTRPRRQSEPTNIMPVDENKFLEMEKLGEIIFSYKKRNYFYGFDAKQFRRAIRFGYPLVSIFTHFKMVPEISKLMRDNGYPTTTIFINVPRKHLMRRVAFRNFSHIELRERIRSIDKDLIQMKGRRTIKEEYIFLDNSDMIAINDSAKQLCDIVIEVLEDSEK